MNERPVIDVGKLLDYLSGVKIGPCVTDKQPDGSYLMGNRVTETDKHGKVIRDEVVYVCRVAHE